MARVPTDFPARRIDSGGAIQVLTGQSARVHVYNRGTTTEAPVFDSASGGTQQTQPIQPNSEGRYPYWIEPGSYDLFAPEDGETQPWEAIAGADSAVVNVIREAPLNVKYPEFGAVGDGVADDHAALQAAVDAAGTLITSLGPYPIVENRVELPAGNFLIGSGKTLRLPKGVELVGNSRSSTRITHGGGGVPCIDTDTALTNNTNITIADLSITGAGATTTAGVKLNDNIRNGTLRNVTVRGCQDNLQVEDCWTLLLERCDLQEATRYNLRWENATAATIRECRIDSAGDHNVYVSPAASNFTVNLVLYNSAIQFAQKAGIFAEDIDQFHILGGYFEGNNKSAGTWADIHSANGPANRGILVSLSGVFGSATGAGTGVRHVHVDRAALSMFGCYNFLGTGTNYAVGVELGANVPRATIVGSRISGTTQITRASTATGIVYLPDPNEASSRLVANSGFASRADSLSIADNGAAFIEFDALLTGGMLLLSSNSAARGSAVVYFRAGDGSAHMSLLSSGGTPTVATTIGALTGTTGIDGNLTLSAHTSLNRIYVENRTGALGGYSYTLLNLPLDREAKELVGV